MPPKTTATTNIILIIEGIFSIAKILPGTFMNGCGLIASVASESFPCPLVGLLIQLTNMS